MLRLGSVRVWQHPSAMTTTKIKPEVCLPKGYWGFRPGSSRGLLGLRRNAPLAIIEQEDLEQEVFFHNGAQNYRWSSRHSYALLKPVSTASCIPGYDTGHHPPYSNEFLRIAQVLQGLRPDD